MSADEERISNTKAESHMKTKDMSQFAKLLPKANIVMGLINSSAQYRRSKYKTASTQELYHINSQQSPIQLN